MELSKRNNALHRVFVVDNSTYVTGAIKSILAVTDSLGGRYQFEFAIDASAEASDYVIDSGYQVHDFNFLEINRGWKTLLYPLALFANGIKLANIARQKNIRIIHVNDLYNLTGLLAKVFNRKLKVVYHVRLIEDSYLRPIYPFLARLVRHWADAIIYVSHAAGELFYDAPQATLIYDSIPVESSLLPPKDLSQTLADCKFLYVGNYVRGKGQDLALRAFAKVAKQLPDSTLRFVGKGASGELDSKFVLELEEWTTHADQVGRVSFEDALNDIEKAMKEADVVVNLSESESFSMVCLEALTYGMPLVVSDCGGPREIVQNEVNGLLVENRNVNHAAEAMLRMATEPGLAIRLATEGPKSVVEKFSVEKSANQLAEIYEGLLSR